MAIRLQQRALKKKIEGYFATVDYMYYICLYIIYVYMCIFVILQQPNRQNGKQITIALQ